MLSKYLPKEDGNRLGIYIKLDLKAMKESNYINVSPNGLSSVTFARKGSNVE